MRNTTTLITFLALVLATPALADSIVRAKHGSSPGLVSRLARLAVSVAPPPSMASR